MFELDVFAGKARFFLGPQFLTQQDVFAQNRAPFAVVEPVIAHFFLAPTVTDPKFKAAIGNHIQTGHFLGQPYRVALCHQRDASAQTEFFGYRGTSGEGDELVVGTPIHFRQRRGAFTATPWCFATRGDMTMLRKPQGFEAPRFDFFGKLYRLYRFVSGENHDAEIHKILLVNSIVRFAQYLSCAGV